MENDFDQLNMLGSGHTVRKICAPPRTVQRGPTTTRRYIIIEIVMIYCLLYIRTRTIIVIGDNIAPHRVMFIFHFSNCEPFSCLASTAYCSAQCTAFITPYNHNNV